MKNYKLDVVRYNNEDVIATSGDVVDNGCNVDTTNYDSMFYIITNKGSGNYEYKLWKDLGSEWFQIQDDPPLCIMDDDGLNSFGDTLVSGKYYHYNSSSHAFEECTNHSQHNLIYADD